MRNDASDVIIRPMEPPDAPGMSALLGRIGTVEGTLQVPDASLSTRLDVLQRMDANDCRLVAVAGTEIVGSVGLHTVQTSLRRRHVRMLGIAVAPDWQGRGLGRRMLLRVLDWADNWAGVLRVELHVHADNPRAIALYQSVGFVEEGRHRAYALKNGVYVDSFSMARLHPRPPALRTTPD